MLYIDQPNQVGFSYDQLTNVTVDLVSKNVTVEDFADGDIPEQNNMFYVGTFSSQDEKSTANTTMNAARSLWHFSQVWFQEFPEYKPEDDRISIWTESYGGKYGPAFAAFFQEQNQKIKDGTITADAEPFVINLDTLGIINGCIDPVYQALSYAEMAYNNTYGIKAINESIYNYMVDTYPVPGGCKDLINQCRKSALEGDPGAYGNNATVNALCKKASSTCDDVFEGPYITISGRAAYDVAHSHQDPFPPEFYLGYLAKPHVQAAIGAPLNFSTASTAVWEAFKGSGDDTRSDVRGYLEDIAYLLDSGVKVALVYGDRDWICNWIGGEEVSLNVDYSQSSKFRDAGYTDVQVNSSYVGGQVRQHGNFSFTRVYQAGHKVPSYQPETSWEIFHRVMFNRDIATGEKDIVAGDSYSTKGSPTTFHIKNEVPPMPAPTCYILALTDTCEQEQLVQLMNGSAVVKDYILVDENTKHMFPDNE